MNGTPFVFALGSPPGGNSLGIISNSHDSLIVIH